MDTSGLYRQNKSLGRSHLDRSRTARVALPSLVAAGKTLPLRNNATSLRTNPAIRKLNMPSTLQAIGAHVIGTHGDLLHPTDLLVRRGELVVVAGEPGHGHTALSLALAGQIHLFRGSVLIDGVPDAGRLRQKVALVDTPGVTEPEKSLSVAVIVGEELSMAHRPASRAAVRAWLAEQGAAEYAGLRWDRTPVVLRTTLLVAAAAARPQTAFIVLTCPDRWGGTARQWHDLASRWVDLGYGVVLQCSEPLAEAMAVPFSRLGAAEDPNRVAPQTERV